MPNLSPVKDRKKYELYDNKICTGDEAAECRVCLKNRVKSVGFELVEDRGECGVIVFTPAKGGKVCYEFSRRKLI